MSSKPQTVTLLWCETCGHDNRWTDLHAGHYDDFGYRCAGEIVPLTYALAGVA